MSQRSKCPRYRLIFINPETGTISEKGCNAYKCPECGPIKTRRLKNAIFNELKNWKHKCFWTFTINSNLTEDKKLHYEVLSEAFNRLIIYLRRDNLISNHKFRYIRVNELHLSGYAHIHVVVDTYFEAHYIIGLWKHLVSCVAKAHGLDFDIMKIGGAFVKYIREAGKMTNYICKYFTKSISIISQPKYFHFFYSKSKSVVFFNYHKEAKEPGDWFVYMITGITHNRLIVLKELSNTKLVNSLLVAELLDNFLNIPEKPG